MIDRIVRLLIALLVLVLIGWGLGMLCRSLLTTIDLRAVRAVASERTPAQTTVAHVLSWIGSGYVIFPQTLVCCAILYLAGRSRPSLAVGLSTGGGGDRHLGKLLVARPRPHVHHLERATSYSFPSGHSAHLAASRVYLGVHYPSDVIAGVALGTAWAIVAGHYVALPITRSTREPRASTYGEACGATRRSGSTRGRAWVPRPVRMIAPGSSRFR